jgi:hypothetical protein
MAWLLVPAGFGIWHYGPGQDRMKLDEVSRLLALGDRYAADEAWAEAVEAYEAALAALPADQVKAARTIRLARAKAQMQASDLNAAHAELRSLVEEMGGDPAADRGVLAEARSAMAHAFYHMTWVMRLEGLPRELWEPEIETARQTYRLLAEQAAEKGDRDAELKHLEDLEAAVRLERMELGELQGLPLPKQCSGCCSGKKPGGKPSKTKAPNKGPKDARGASSGPPPDTTGH